MGFSNIPITTGSIIDGHIITNYHDIVTIEEVVQIDSVAVLARKKYPEELESLLWKGKQNAINKLKSVAISEGAHAIIGYSCKYLHFDPTTAIPAERHLWKYTVCIIVEGIPVSLVMQTGCQTI